MIEHGDRPRHSATDMPGLPGSRHEVSQHVAEQRLRMAQEAAGFGIWEWDRLADILVLDEGCCRMLGHDPATHRAMSYADWRASVHPEDLPHIEASVEQQLSTGRTFTYEFRHRRADGDWLWVQSRGRTVRLGEDGSPALIVGTYVDVHQLKEAEFALRRREQELTEAMRIGRLGHWTYEPDTGDIAWSPEIYEFFGIAPSSRELCLERLLGMLHPDDRPAVEAAIERTLRSGEPYVIEHRVRRPDGGERILYARGCAELDPLGQPRMLRGTVQDVTEDRELRRSLARANETKDTFLRAVSHDLRTPLNALTGFLDLLDQPDLPEALRTQYMGRCRQGAERLLRLINTLLDLSRLQAGRLELSPEVFSLRELIGEQLANLEGSARDKGLHLDSRIDPEVAEWVEGDATRLGQVLSNLLGNAVKYTRAGAVQLAVDVGEVGSEIRFAVQDTGPGISRAERERIFQPFDRGAYRGCHPGHGLGLAIVRELVQLLGGSLSLESSPGRGSTFTFAIPLPAAAPPPEAGSGVGEDPGHGGGPLMAKRALHVLVADDDPTSTMLARAMLEQLGCSVAVAHTGSSAIEQWRSEHFDLLLLDLNMPDLNGCEVVWQVRSAEGERGESRVTIALCTGYAAEDIERLGCGADFDARLTKPITRQDLDQLVRWVALHVHEPTRLLNAHNCIKNHHRM